MADVAEIRPDSSHRHPRVDRERVLGLLAAGGESAALDFKRELHPASRRDLVKLARHVGAMAAQGGDLVIGADESGRPTGRVTDRDVVLLDEAALRGKLSTWLPPLVAYRTAVHEIDECAVVIVAVEPHPHGICIMAADGAYEGGVDFHAGDVFVRRGTQSVRWAEHDVVDFADRVRRAQREEVRAEVRRDWETAMRTAGPASTLHAAPLAALSWALDLDTFVETALERLRAGDDIGLRRLLVGLPKEVAQMSRESRGIERTAELLDRVVALLAQSLVAGRTDVFQMLLRRLTASYETALANPHPASSVQPSTLGLMILERLYPVGALAVREGRYDLVRALATEPLDDPGQGNLPFLLAHIQRSAERYRFFEVVDRHRAAHVWVLSRAEERARANAWMLPDTLADDDRVLTSLCAFDVLCALAATDALGGEGALRLMFANFAGWYSQRTDPVVIQLLDQRTPVRKAVFRGDDRALAIALLTLRDQALRRWGLALPPWDGYEDPRIRAFLARFER